jgi:Swiss Army Knife protein, DSP-PTPase phosphatase domain
VVCQHTEDSVLFPDGTQVLASGWLHRTTAEVTPDFGLYLDPQWTPHWPAVLLDWPDFGVPADRAAADREIRGAFARARAGERVEVACIGGHGRTGTVLACMAILAGVPPHEAVEWVRSRYCRRAVQEPSQQYWIDRFAERVASHASESA